jgi:hypothetical protein
MVTRLLTTELIARESKNYKTFVSILAVKLLQDFVLRSKAAIESIKSKSTANHSEAVLTISTTFPFSELKSKSFPSSVLAEKLYSFDSSDMLWN